MKNFIIAIVLFFAFFALSNRSEAACPPGYSTETVTFTYDDCSVIVTYCYWKSPSNMRYTIVESITYSLLSPCGGVDTQDQAFWELLEKKLMEDAHTIDAFAPCGEGTTPNIQIQKAGCWQITNYNAPPAPYSVVTPCQESGYCRNIYRACFNLSTNLFEYYLLTSEVEILGNCTETPIFTSGFGQIETSSCFIICE